MFGLYNYRKITDDIYYIGADDRRLALFEGVYDVPYGVSYNSYLVTDEKAMLLDTVDRAVSSVFMENLSELLGDRQLDYIVVNHMEPDHSATLLDVLSVYPEATVICSAVTKRMLGQFFDIDSIRNTRIISEGDTISTGKHEFTFVSAPMVHWPEVTVTFDKTEGILFSADAFGTFGALGGALFCDEVEFERDHLDEARRYYTNIVGKYGNQVKALLDKASTLSIRMICPLHGFVWRKNIPFIIEKYKRWSSYTPERDGVMIAYASVYGNTENAAAILATSLRERGVSTRVFDVSVTPASEIVSASFEYSHLVFASTTYNAGIFVKMEDLLRDLTAHNISNRKVVFIENGSWAATSGRLMNKLFEGSNGIEIIAPTVTLRSSVKDAQREAITSLAETISQSVKSGSFEQRIRRSSAFDTLSYGLFVLTSKDGARDNGCIINTVMQISDATRKIISVSVNKQNLTHDMIVSAGEFNLSVLSVEADFSVYERFGYHSGRDTDKFPSGGNEKRSSNGIAYIDTVSCSYISAKVIESVDCDTHTVFIAEVTDSKMLSDDAPATYEHYLKRIKPAPRHEKEKNKGFVCKICGYIYEGEELPEDFVCPLCKHGAADFEPIG